jgi:two-component sensor histidine kinase
VSDVFLGLIAAATLAMAIGQIGLLVVVLRLSKRVEAMSARVEREIGPLAERLTRVAENLQQASSLAAVQIERVDRLFAGASKRADATMSLVQGAVVGPIREGLAVIAALRGVIAAVRSIRGSGTGRAASKFDDEDPLFIG